MLFVFLTSVLVCSSDCPQTHNPFALGFGMLAFESVTPCPAMDMAYHAMSMYHAYQMIQNSLWIYMLQTLHAEYFSYFMIMCFEIQMVQWYQLRIPLIIFRFSRNCLSIFIVYI
jgi:hypothetical protein